MLYIAISMIEPISTIPIVLVIEDSCMHQTVNIFKANNSEQTKINLHVL